MITELNASPKTSLRSCGVSTTHIGGLSLCIQGGCLSSRAGWEWPTPLTTNLVLWPPTPGVTRYMAPGLHRVPPSPVLGEVVPEAKPQVLGLTVLRDLRVDIPSRPDFPDVAAQRVDMLLGIQIIE